MKGVRTGISIKRANSVSRANMIIKGKKINFFLSFRKTNSSIAMPILPMVFSSPIDQIVELFGEIP